MKRTDCVVANQLETHWLSQHSLPTENAMDRGGEIASEVQDLLKNKCCVNQKEITSHNPQIDSMIKRRYQTAGNVIRSPWIRAKTDLDPKFGFDGLLSALGKAMSAAVHTTSHAPPTQLAFNRDAMLNASSEAD